MTESNCPCCGRHCPVEHLSCPKGRRYFGKEEPEGRRPEQPEDKLVGLLRICGHVLHHTEDGGALLQGLSPEERETLEKLLEKCLAGCRPPEGHSHHR